ncbi:MAG: ATP-grasp domain-containing protein [Bacteroidaceae bacterium]|nr:ATP-grasp domain-containing protein [Bacteroidaceae bacterium]
MDDKLYGKRLLVLGGSTWKEAIRDFASIHGITIIAAGLYKVGIYDIADECYTLDITNKDIMIPFLKEKKIDGVYMGGAEPVISAACQYLNDIGLPCYCTKRQWDLLQDKRNFKELCKQNGLPVVPRYDIEQGRNNFDFPVIVKPADGCGSNGFSICYDSSKLKVAYSHAANNSPTRSVICEKFVNNNSVVFFGTFSNGHLYFSGLEDKIPVKYENEGSYVGGLFIFESKKKEEFRNLYENKLEQMFNSIGIKEGPIWIEVFYDNGNYFFNEVGFRYGGSVSIYPIDYFYGYNQVASDIYYALTGESRIIDNEHLIPPTIKRKQLYCIYPVHLYPGVIKKIVGYKLLKDNSSVIFANLTKNEGDEVKHTASFSQVISLVHFVCNNLDECKKMIDVIHQTFQVLDENGNNLINRMLKSENVRFLA